MHMSASLIDSKQIHTTFFIFIMTHLPLLSWIIAFSWNLVHLGAKIIKEFDGIRHWTELPLTHNVVRVWFVMVMMKVWVMELVRHALMQIVHLMSIIIGRIARWTTFHIESQICGLFVSLSWCYMVRIGLLFVNDWRARRERHPLPHCIHVGL